MVEYSVGGNVSCRAVVTIPTLDGGQLLALSCHRKQAGGKKTGSWRLLWRDLLGEITSLSQLVAERLVLNFDPSCCTLILRRDLILFIRPGVAYSRLSTALQLHTHQRQGEATNGPITISRRHFDIWRRAIRTVPLEKIQSLLHFFFFWRDDDLHTSSTSL